jgi:thioredoxin-related protein
MLRNLSPLRYQILTGILLTLLTICILSLTSSAKRPVGIKMTDNVNASDSITWYNMTDGHKLAVSENKILLVDMYTDWCYWCKVMDVQTYKDPVIIGKMNESYIAVKFNPEVEMNHIVGEDTLSSTQLLRLLNKGGRNPGYPTTYIWKNLDRNSDIKPYAGFIKPAQFGKILSEYATSDEQ